ncbi:helix-turn-helix transcriptional regulator, partial [Klebsiella pneumoniae]|uniref:helix-turn-helix transcriptional regulator n=2 Tax=Bacteria TaxID=2 RepID=UPI00190F70D3
MEQPVKAPAECDATCFGTEADMQGIRASLIDRETSSEMADWFKAFSDPTRLRIIDALLQKEL